MPDQFQYNRVLQYVKDSSELVLPQSLTADTDNTDLRVGNMDACENLRNNQNMAAPPSGVSSGGQPVAGGSQTAAAATDATVAGAPGALPRSASAVTAGPAPAADTSVPSVSVYMDAHLARHLVQYVQLLQRIFMAKSTKAMATGE